MRDILLRGPASHGIRTEIVEMVEKMDSIGENRVGGAFLKYHATKGFVTLARCPACGSM